MPATMMLSQSPLNQLSTEQLDDDSYDEEPVLVDGINIEPRPYQRRIILKAIQMFRGDYRDQTGQIDPAVESVMVESPTGSGKTVMGLAVAHWMQREHGFSIGWVAMRRNLLTQAVVENVTRGFNVDVKPISMFDKEPPKVDMLIIDEAQHDGAMSMANLHCIIRPKKVLGLTATPFRTDRIKLCFDKVIKDAGIHQLIQDGYLSRYHHYTIPEYTPSSVASFFANDQQRWGKSLIFFHRNDQCDECQSRLAARGIRSQVVTATTNREKQLADFEAGRVDVLINMAILTEGFDCPSLKTVFCRPSGRGCTIQMSGRVFRKHTDLPIKQIVQCKGTRHPMIKTAMANEQYAWMDGEWRTLKLNEEITAISNNARRMMANAKVELPKVVAAHRRRPLPWQQQDGSERFYNDAMNDD